MKFSSSALAAILMCTATSAFAADAVPDPLTKAIPSSYLGQWMRQQEPVRIYGDTYFVGSAGLSNVLIRTDAGLILIDGALPQSVAAIEANIKKLGFRIEDVKFILSTESHFDHAGGVAALVRDSGGSAVTSPLGAASLRTGRVAADDPQSGDIADAPPVARVREIGDREVLQLGKTAVTAHFTPGHTPGSTSWSWSSCENGKCLNFVFGASLNAVSADNYRFSDSKNAAVVASFRSSMRAFAALPCDILISAHPDNSGGDRKMALLLAQPRATPNPFVDPAACGVYAATAEKKLEARLAKEKAAAAVAPAR